MVTIPMFGAARTPAHPGDHAVLLDGERASFAFFVGNSDQLLEEEIALSWSWSSNLRHTLIFDRDRRKLLVRRWDKKTEIREYTAPDCHAAQKLVDEFDGLPPPSVPTVIDKMITVFRIVRSNIEALRGTPLDVLHAFNALLVGTGAVKRGAIDSAEWSGADTLGSALDLIRSRNLASISPTDISIPVKAFAIQELAQALVERDPTTRYDLDPDLLVRHAAGILYQEAHAELSRFTPQFQQRTLFPIVSLHATKPITVTSSDIHFTPPTLARALVEEAVAALHSVRSSPTPSRIHAIDPACGSGVFLIEALRDLSLSRHRDLALGGADISALSGAMTVFCLQRVIRDETGVAAKVSIDIRTEDSLTSTSWGAPDLLLMNPPFTSWLGMTVEERKVVKDVLGPLYHGIPDKASAFVCKAIREMKPGSVLATVIPASFLESKSAHRLRKFIDSDTSLALHLLGRFRGYAYFHGARVEPAFIVISRSENGTHQNQLVKVLLADDGHEDRAIRELRTNADGQGRCEGDGWELFQEQRAAFTPASWMPRSRKAADLIAAMTGAGLSTAGNLFDIKRGIQTGNNRLFIIKEDKLRAFSCSESELRLFLPAIASRDVIRDGKIRRTEYVFYPYDKNGKALFDNESELAKAAPTFYKRVLKPNHDKLAARPGLRSRQWWELIEPRTTWPVVGRPKLVSSYFGGAGKFAYDINGEFAPIQGFGWLWRGTAFQETELPFAYLALLNSSVFESVLALFCPQVEYGQLDLSRRFVGRTFVPDLSDVRNVSQQVIAELASIGRSISEHRQPSLDTLDEAVASAYGLPLKVLRGVQSLDGHFQELVREWKAARGHTSSVTRMAKIAAYQRIIAMGKVAVPLILAELRRKPDHYFLALNAITEADPIPPTSRGKINEMANAWLQWGADRGYIK